MRNLRRLVVQVLEDDVPGDFIETGVWRGGACIFMRAILAAYGDSDRRVWVTDSFAGLPPPNPDAYPADAGDTHHIIKALAVPLEEVKDNFSRYNMLDDKVIFLKGWFKDTLATAPIEQLAILRLDGDMYESTIQALDGLYHKLSPGGFTIIDDYDQPHCRMAVTDFRSRRDVTEQIVEIDERGVFWRKSPVGETDRATARA
jgi:O-methyltransferase